MIAVLFLEKKKTEGNISFQIKKTWKFGVAFPLCENLLSDNPFCTTGHQLFLRMGGWSQWANALLKEELPVWFNMYMQYPLSS